MPKNKISKARSAFITQSPFLGDLALRLKVVEGKTKTMATDAVHLYYDPAFVLSLPQPQLEAVIAHEVAHCLFRHAGNPERGKGFPVKVWMVACEYMANHFVVDMCNLELPKDCIYSKKYNTGKWTTEDIAKDILKNHQLDIDMLATKIGDHEKWKENQETDAEWQIHIAQAMHNAKKRGNLPAGLAHMVDDMLEPKVSWQQQLAEFVQIARDDYSWRRPNKRHIHRGFYAPSIRSETINIGFCMDTSGSMSEKELPEGLAELTEICSSFSSYTIHLFACDAKVQDYQIIKQGDSVDIKRLMKGGGGTDFRPVYKYISDNQISIDCLVYFTDGYGEFGCEPEYPVLWVLNSSAKIPWGRLVRL